MAEMMTAQDIAKELRCSLSHAYTVARRCVHLSDGRMVRVSRRAFEAYLSRHETVGTDLAALQAPAGPRRRARAGLVANSNGGPQLRPTQPRTPRRRAAK